MCEAQLTAIIVISEAAKVEGNSMCQEFRQMA